MKPVSEKEYLTRALPYAQEQYTLELQGWQVAALHGMIALAASHPGMQKTAPISFKLSRDIRNKCLEVMATWGFRQEELEFLDKSHEEASHEPGPSSQTGTPAPGSAPGG